MLSETLKRTRMYAGIPQHKLAEALCVSEATYSRKENGITPFERQEAIKAAKILDLKENVVLKYWIADKLYTLMKSDKNLVYEALQIVETNFENYENCVEIPQYNNSFSTVRDRKQRKRKNY